MEQLYQEGKKPSEIKQMLQMGDISRQTFYNCVNYEENEETKHKTRKFRVILLGHW